MSNAANTATYEGHIACECGGDHRETKCRICPAIVILNDLHGLLEEFSDVLDVLEFGKEGPLADCLGEETMIRYESLTKAFATYQTISEQHPEWRLEVEISRLRRYFDQIAEDCAEKKNACSDQAPQSERFLPKVVRGEGTMLEDAKLRIHTCYHEGYNAVVTNGILHLLRTDDLRGWPEQVEAAYNNALDAIMLLPANDSATAQHLTKQLFEIRKGIRRIFFDFEPRKKEIYRSDVYSLRVRR